MGLTMKPRELVRFLETKGFVFIRAKGGSHHIYGKGVFVIPIPIHGGKDFDEDFIKVVLREAGISKKELMDYLNR
ncbi:MAG: type II toxin-antitoxin system HicA family toxin [Firmicutes bacterium]|nr:type II toxin-antitoxin system HicA family toxin [Bacillota bacterium]